MLNLTKRLVEVAEEDKKFGECEVKFYQLKINKRSATCIQVVHPVPRKNFRFNKALVFVDDELNIPVRYESYDWPETQGGPPQLLEEYTYTDSKSTTASPTPTSTRITLRTTSTSLRSGRTRSRKRTGPPTSTRCRRPLLFDGGCHIFPWTHPYRQFSMQSG